MASPLIRFSVGCRGDFFNSFNDFQAAILVDLADDNEFLAVHLTPSVWQFNPNLLFQIT